MTSKKDNKKGTEKSKNEPYFDYVKIESQEQCINYQTILKHYLNRDSPDYKLETLILELLIKDWEIRSTDFAEITIKIGPYQRQFSIPLKAFHEYTHW